MPCRWTLAWRDTMGKTLTIIGFGSRGNTSLDLLAIYTPVISHFEEFHNVMSSYERGTGYRVIPPVYTGVINDVGYHIYYHVRDGDAPFTFTYPPGTPKLINCLVIFIVWPTSVFIVHQLQTRYES